MRVGITLSVSSADLDRLHALVSNRNAPQKHVWQARIVFLTAEGIGTSAIMRETSKSKTCCATRQGLRASRSLIPLSPNAS
jgi:hypothetical protein